MGKQFQEFIDSGLKDILDEWPGLLLDEDANQLDKWGFQRKILFDWLACITEEVGELSEAISEWIHRDGKLSKVSDEAIQLATLAIKVAIMTMEREEGE